MNSRFFHVKVNVRGLDQNTWFELYKFLSRALVIPQVSGFLLFNRNSSLWGNKKRKWRTLKI